MDTGALVFVIVALVAGLGLGWFFGSRPVAEWRARHGEREAEVKDHAEEHPQIVRELTALHEAWARSVESK